MPWKDQCYHAHLNFLWFERRRSRRQAISMADLPRLPLLLSEGASSELYRSRDSGQSTTIGQLGGLQHSAADAPKPTTSPASSSRPFDCLLLCFKAILSPLAEPATATWEMICMQFLRLVSPCQLRMLMQKPDAPHVFGWPAMRILNASC